MSLSLAHIDAIAVGASSGGIDALTHLLQALPEGFTPAVIIVQHLPAHPAASLAALLASHCTGPVKEAQDKEPIVPGTVYIAQGGYHLLVEPGHTLSLSLDERVNFSRPSIDLMMKSAALAYGPRLLGIILTGANNDGAAGLLAIRKLGGQTWVQDPSQASASTMPAAAIAAGAADHILPIPQMALHLASGLRRQARTDPRKQDQHAGPRPV